MNDQGITKADMERDTHTPEKQERRKQDILGAPSGAVREPKATGAEESEERQALLQEFRNWLNRWGDYDEKHRKHQPQLSWRRGYEACIRDTHDRFDRVHARLIALDTELEPGQAEATLNKASGSPAGGTT